MIIIHAGCRFRKNKVFQTIPCSWIFRSQRKSAFGSSWHFCWNWINANLSDEHLRGLQSMVLHRERSQSKRYHSVPDHIIGVVRCEGDAISPSKYEFIISARK
jgi:hypothetical protein